ncbi:MAG: PKD domain-containing protein, partial [Chloroflexi bacterium]|nr:PKD domain-containing protein [Chloroflexota bacterium]
MQFTDLSTGGPTGWSWTFGDGGTSTSQNPSHTYNTAGSYTVGLTASNSGGFNTKTVGNFISVTLTASANLVSADGYHTCVLTTGGGVKCWGYNFDGELGDGTTTNRTTPVDVSGLTSDVIAIAAGGSHTCALTTGGGVKCWGYNGYGELGDGTTTQRLTAVDVVGLTSGVSAIAGGGYHTCALTTGGGVKCWGYNGNGELGDGTTTNRSTPVDVSGLTSGVVAIATGYFHTCALITSGGVKCWGYNFDGELGDGTTTQRLTAVDVSGLTSGASAIAAGSWHTCALTTSGGVKCWGYNGNGELGDGTTANRSTLVDVSGLTSAVIAIATGGYHTCALTTGGGVKCWGYNYYGELGDGTTTQRTIPVGVSGLTSGVSVIAAGWHHTCALTTGGGVKCWGANYDGQLGDGTTTQRLTAVDVIGFSSLLTNYPNTPANPVPTNNAILERTNNTILYWTTNGTTCDVHVGGGSLNIHPTGLGCSSLYLGVQWPGVYQWQVTATNSYGSAPGPVWSYSIKPYAPTSLNASTASATQINLSWAKSADDPGNVDNYAIYYSSGTLITTVGAGATSYNVSGLNCN